MSPTIPSQTRCLSSIIQNTVLPSRLVAHPLHQFVDLLAVGLQPYEHFFQGGANIFFEFHIALLIEIVEIIGEAPPFLEQPEPPSMAPL